MSGFLLSFECSKVGMYKPFEMATNAQKYRSTCSTEKVSTPRHAKNREEIPRLKYWRGLPHLFVYKISIEIDSYYVHGIAFNNKNLTLKIIRCSNKCDLIINTAVPLAGLL